MPKPTHVVAVILVLTCLTLPAAASDSKAASQPNPPVKNPDAVQAGKTRFAQNCGACHGSSAGGGRGPKLADSRRVHEMADKKIFDIIESGIPGTGMPSNHLPERQIWEIVAFLRSLNSTAGREFVPGDATNGKALFFGVANCAQCHAIAGQGGILGPDLSDLATRKSADSIKESITAPSQLVEPGFAGVVILMADGKRLEGVVKNESAYSIQLMDMQGNFHSVLKSEVSDIVRRSESLMPPAVLSPSQLQDIVAFLSRQRAGAGTMRTKKESAIR